MNILLVYPSYPTTFWSFNHALKFIGKKLSHPPIGLLTVAAMLPKRWNLKLIDLNIVNIKDEDILWADYVFISGMTVQKQSAEDVIARCLRLNRKVVAGGPLFSCEPENFPNVHHLLLNEAEITLPEFLHDLELGCPKSVYRTSEWADIAVTPVPMWELIDLKNYATMCVQSSRGCPHDCEFCDITVLFGRKTRIKPVDNVINELESLYQKGWRGNVFFVDDNFIGNKSVVKDELLPAIIKWMKRRKYPFTFLTQVTITLANDDVLMNLMTQAGFNTIFVGIETPDKESLIECGKFHNVKCDMTENVKKLQSIGLQVHGGFIVGFDNDNEDIFNRMVHFINESGIVSSMVGLLNALPNTRLYKRLLKENRLIKNSTGNNTDFSINFLPKMDYNSLIDGYKKLLEDIYKPEVYYKRIRTFLRNYQHVGKSHEHFSTTHFRGLVMSLYKLGIKSEVRKHFWKLIAWTLLRRPRLIPIALTSAIYGEHFMRYYKIIT